MKKLSRLFQVGAGGETGGGAGVAMSAGKMEEIEGNGGRRRRKAEECGEKGVAMKDELI